jgi:hypothetical protein
VSGTFYRRSRRAGRIGGNGGSVVNQRPIVHPGDSQSAARRPRRCGRVVVGGFSVGDDVTAVQTAECPPRFLPDGNLRSCAGEGHAVVGRTITTMNAEVLGIFDHETDPFQADRVPFDVVCAGDSLTGWGNFGPPSSSQRRLHCPGRRLHCGGHDES